jgi:phospholipid transport system transporter-binding protein
VISGNGNRMQLQGSLTMRTVGKLYGSGLQLQGASSLVVDLSQVAEVDSSAVSLMLSWLREAQRNNVNLCFSHVPDNLLSLARLYGIAEILPVCPAE